MSPSTALSPLLRPPTPFPVSPSLVVSPQGRGPCCPHLTPVSPPQKYPPSATTLHFEFYAEPGVEVKVDKRVSDTGDIWGHEGAPKASGPPLDLL